MNKYEDRKFTDLAKSKRFVSLIITTLVSLLLYYFPEGLAYRELVLESMFAIVFLVIATFGLEDVVERLGDAFYAIWGTADEIVDASEAENVEVNISVEKDV